MINKGYDQYRPPYRPPTLPPPYQIDYHIIPTLWDDNCGDKWTYPIKE